MASHNISKTSRKLLAKLNDETLSIEEKKLVLDAWVALQELRKTYELETRKLDQVRELETRKPDKTHELEVTVRQIEAKNSQLEAKISQLEAKVRQLETHKVQLETHQLELQKAELWAQQARLGIWLLFLCGLLIIVGWNPRLGPSVFILAILWGVKKWLE